MRTLAGAVINKSRQIYNYTINNSPIKNPLSLDDIGKYKSEVSKKILTNINDITSLKSYPVSFEKYLEKESIDHFDLVMDCTDSHQNKIFSSKYCKNKFIPFVSISINSSDGIYFSQNYRYHNKASSCFECLFPQTE